MAEDKGNEEAIVGLEVRDGKGRENGESIEVGAGGGGGRREEVMEREEGERNVRDNRE